MPTYGLSLAHNPVSTNLKVLLCTSDVKLLDNNFMENNVAVFTYRALYVKTVM